MKMYTILMFALVFVIATVVQQFFPLDEYRLEVKIILLIALICTYLFRKRK